MKAYCALVDHIVCPEKLHSSTGGSCFQRTAFLEKLVSALRAAVMHDYSIGYGTERLYTYEHDILAKGNDCLVANDRND